MMSANSFDQYTRKLPSVAKPGSHLSVVHTEKILLNILPAAWLHQPELDFSIRLREDRFENKDAHIMEKARTERIVSGYIIVVF